MLRVSPDDPDQNPKTEPLMSKRLGFACRRGGSCRFRAGRGRCGDGPVHAAVLLLCAGRDTNVRRAGAAGLL